MANLPYQDFIQIDVTPDGIIHEPGRHGSPAVRFAWTSWGYAAEEKDHPGLMDSFSPESLMDHVDKDMILQDSAHWA